MKDWKKRSRTLFEFHTTMTEEEYLNEILGWFNKKPKKRKRTIKSLETDSIILGDLKLTKLLEDLKPEKKKPLFTNLTPIYKIRKTAPSYEKKLRDIKNKCPKNKDGKHTFVDQANLGWDRYVCLCGLTIYGNALLDKSLCKLLKKNSTGIYFIDGIVNG